MNEMWVICLSRIIEKKRRDKEFCSMLLLPIKWLKNSELIIAIGKSRGLNLENSSIGKSFFLTHMYMYLSLLLNQFCHENIKPNLSIQLTSQLVCFKTQSYMKPCTKVQLSRKIRPNSVSNGLFISKQL